VFGGNPNGNRAGSAAEVEHVHARRKLGLRDERPDRGLKPEQPCQRIVKREEPVTSGRRQVPLRHVSII
jgi:hypothetical protein